jgi:hypothetical protein
MSVEQMLPFDIYSDVQVCDECGEEHTCGISQDGNWCICCFNQWQISRGKDDACDMCNTSGRMTHVKYGPIVVVACCDCKPLIQTSFVHLRMFNNSPTEQPSPAEQSSPTPKRKKRGVVFDLSKNVEHNIVKTFEELDGQRDTMLRLSRNFRFNKYQGLLIRQMKSMTDEDKETALREMEPITDEYDKKKKLLKKWFGFNSISSFHINEGFDTMRLLLTPQETSL